MASGPAEVQKLIPGSLRRSVYKMGRGTLEGFEPLVLGDPHFHQMWGVSHRVVTPVLSLGTEEKE